MLGRRALVVSALVAFLVGSLSAGAAQSMSELIAARAVQGFGAGGLMVLTLVVIADIVPLSQRGKLMGLYGLVLGAASLVGPVVGGLLTDHFGWRWAFLINLPLGGLALTVVLVALRLPKRPTSRPVDALGFFTLSGAVISTTLLTSWAGVRNAWGSPTILGLAATAGALTVAFLLVERTALDPLIPLRLFTNRTIAVAFVVNMLLFTVVNGCATFMPMFLQLVTGRTATDSGLLTAPMVVGLMVSSIGAGALITRFQRYVWAPVVGCALASLVVGLMSLLGPRSSQLVVIADFVAFGIALGLIMQPLTLGVQASAPESDIGAATATTAFAQRIGGAVGLATLGALFTGRLGTELAHRLPHGAQANGLAGGSITPASLSRLPAAVQQGVEAAYLASITTVFRVSVVVMTIAFVLTLLLRNIRLSDTEVRSDLDTLSH
jgi:EmrB/QacA subfamily drug resistance transporter